VRKKLKTRPDQSIFARIGRLQRRGARQPLPIPARDPLVHDLSM
jgi:hypothetical protein